MSREKILTAIRATTSQIAEKEPLPDYDPAILHSAPKLEGTDLWEIFSRNFSAVNGKPMDSLEALSSFLREGGHLHGYCDPALLEKLRPALPKDVFTVETTFDRTRYEDYQFGITRASGAIAESGSLILDDFKTSDRLAALSPWVHIAVLLRDEIIRTIPEATLAFGDAPNLIWVTGPSKTADVEGILIEGVHGPGEQIALLLA